MTRASSPLRDQMLFLVGAQRSGTNWLQRILAVHPEVASLPSETQLFTIGISQVAEVVHHGVVSSPSTAGLYMDPEAFYDATRVYCDALFGSLAAKLNPGWRFILERSPNHVFHLDLIAAVYPDARVVHIIRDGRDVARSQLAQTYGPVTIVEAAREWRRAIETARRTGPQFAQYVEVRYERLLADPPAVVRKVFGELDLRYDDDLVDAAVREAQVPFNVDPSDRRVGSGKWRESWNREEVEAFLDEIGPIAEEFGMRADEATSRRPRPGRSLRRRRRGPVSATQAVPTPREPDAELIRRATRVVDAFLSALATRQDSLLAERSTSDISVRVVAAGGDERASGTAGVALLLRAVRDDDVDWNVQVRGDVHAGSPTFTAVLTHAGPDGRMVDRVLVIRPRGEQIQKVTYYRIPLAGPS